MRPAISEVLVNLLTHPVVAEGGIDQRISSAMQPFADVVSGAVFAAIPMFGHQVPWILFWLIAIAIFCTFYFRLINVRGLAQGFRIIRGDYAEASHAGDTTHFQALATALSGTIGLGNIAGVAVAITLGGPGATFWMIVAALFGMGAKFCECTLAVKFRREHADGSVSGGPMHYLRYGIAAEYPRLAPLGAILAITFAVFCVFGSIGAGNMFQANAAYQQLLFITGGEQSFLAGRAWVFGVVMAVLVGLVVIGGIRRIASVTGKLVPLMGVLYLLAGIVVLIANYERIPAAFASILTGAFTPQGVAGGAVGVMLMGFRRAAFSNEAGIGSSPIAHATVRTGEPLTEGLVALWEPLIDTVVICTMTALVIIVSDAALSQPGAEGVVLTSHAFGTVLPWFPYVLSVFVFLFAYSTMIAYCYYGTKATTYLLGESPRVELGYKIFFCAITVVGVTMDFSRLIDFSDATYFLMAVPNVIGLYLLAPVVKREMDSYFARLSRGEIRSTRGQPQIPVASL